MSKHFYRDIQLIKFCKKCGVEYRPRRFSYQAASGLCIVCRRAMKAKYWREVGLPRFRALSPEQRREIWKKRYPSWLKWVAKNLPKRRKMALDSYHRRKEEHWHRRHRSTKKTA